jgi:electron transport complex protein RnfE
MKYIKLMKNGIIDQNPVFVQVLALCPLLAVTTSAVNGLAMGLATTAVMVSASTVVSIMRKVIPNDIRIACYVIVIAGFVTIVQLIMEAYAPPEINDGLGIFIPLIVVNCILFARVESFAFKNKIFDSAVDALGMGIGFTIGLFTVGFIREFFGTGSVLGYELLKDTSAHMLIMIMAPGAFFTLGVLIMIMNILRLKKRANTK